MERRLRGVCPICEEYVGRVKVGNHFKQFHPEYDFKRDKRVSLSGNNYSVYICETCGISTGNFADLVRHYRTYHTDKLNNHQPNNHQPESLPEVKSNTPDNDVVTSDSIAELIAELVQEAKGARSECDKYKLQLVDVQKSKDKLRGMVLDAQQALVQLRNR